MKKQVLFVILMVLPLVASAHDIAVTNADGVTIYYTTLMMARSWQLLFVAVLTIPILTNTRVT